jgi:hypothetical protein
VSDRWTICVCECGTYDDFAYTCPHCSTTAKPVEVCPVTELEAARAGAEEDDHAAQRWMVTAEDLEVRCRDVAEELWKDAETWADTDCPHRWGAAKRCLALAKRLDPQEGERVHNDVDDLLAHTDGVRQANLDAAEDGLL